MKTSLKNRDRAWSFTHLIESRKQARLPAAKELTLGFRPGVTCRRGTSSLLSDVSLNCSSFACHPTCRAWRNISNTRIWQVGPQGMCSESSHTRMKGGPGHADLLLWCLNAIFLIRHYLPFDLRTLRLLSCSYQFRYNARSRVIPIVKKHKYNLSMTIHRTHCEIQPYLSCNLHSPSFDMGHGTAPKALDWIFMRFQNPSLISRLANCYYRWSASQNYMQQHTPTPTFNSLMVFAKDSSVPQLYSS